MRPLLKGAVAAAVLAALGQPQARPRPPVQQAGETAPAPVQSAQPGQLLCPPGSLPLTRQGRCIPLDAMADGRGTSRDKRLAADRDRPVRLSLRTPGDSIPLLPGRPSSLERYKMPIDPVLDIELAGQSLAEPEQGPHLIIEGEPGSEVRLLALDGQTEKAQVLLVGQLEGVTVALRHTIDGPSGPTHVIALYGRLTRPGPQVVNGARLEEGALLGHLTEEDEDIGTLRLQLRREREDSTAVPHLSKLVSPLVSITIDPRNMLPLGAP